MRSFSSAFITTQSSSPFISLLRVAGSVCRFAAMLGRVLVALSRVLGRGGSSSRTTRSTSNSAAFLNRSRSIGVEPVSNSYSSTPSEYTSERVSMSIWLKVACSGLM